MIQDQPEQLIAQIDEILHHRFAQYPAKDPQNRAKQLHLLSQLTDQLILMNEVSETAEEPTTNHVKINPMTPHEVSALVSQPVFIGGFMKSGTTLITELLDGHPDLCVLPGDTQYIKKRQQLSSINFADSANACMRILVNPTSKPPFWFFGENVEPYRLFLAYFRKYLDQTNHDYLVCFMLSMTSTLQHNTPTFQPRYWVEKTPGNEKNLDEIRHLYPAAKFIHLVRDPLQNIASLQKLVAHRQWQPSAEDHAYSMNRRFAKIPDNQATWGNNYLVLRYEDLVKRPQVTMQNVARFLQIDFTDTLLTPTNNRKNALANSMYAESRVVGKILDKAKLIVLKKNAVLQEKYMVVKLMEEAAALRDKIQIKFLYIFILFW